MDKEQIINNFLQDKKNNYILQLPTGYGKTKLALDKVNSLSVKNILIVIPKRVNIGAWHEEIHKFHYEHLLEKITFSTYVSLPKQNTKWDVVILDEGHHTTERCKDALRLFNIKHLLVLSATLKKDTKWFFKDVFKCNIYSVDLQTAIETKVLPDPTIVLYPIRLDNTKVNYTIVKNNKAKSVIECNYIDRWKYQKDKSHKVLIKCTQLQYYQDLHSLVDWYKRRAMGGNQIFKNQWLNKAGQRLKWLADEKTELVKSLLLSLQEKRVLTFCSGIEQSELLKAPCVNSKVGTSNLELFNNNKINHITAVNMLDEGMNLTNCQIGILQMINSSDRIQIQRIGRILRHKKPVILIPYYVNSREEEIVRKMIEGYNKELIKKISNINDLYQLIC